MIFGGFGDFGEFGEFYKKFTTPKFLSILVNFG